MSYTFNQTKRLAVYTCDRCRRSLETRVPAGVAQPQLARLVPGGWKLSGIRHVCVRCTTHR